MQQFSGKLIHMLQYLSLSEQPLDIHLVSCIIKKKMEDWKILKTKLCGRKPENKFPAELQHLSDMDSKNKVYMAVLPRLTYA